MADASASGRSGRNMIEVAAKMAEELREHFPPDPDTAYIVVAVDTASGDIGWISQVEEHAVLEIFGRVVAQRRN